MASAEPPVVRQPHDEPLIVRRLIFYVIAGTFIMCQMAFLGALAIVFIWPRPPQAAITKLVLAHFTAIIVLPVAALMAFVVVWAFRATEGAIEWEALGFKFRGASGPVVLWTMVFAAIAGATKLLW
jgi:hypothetical protein